METTLRALYDHDRWATLALIDHLAGLPPETLELDAPGTYGSIGGTLIHIVDAAEGYLARLEDRPPPDRPAEDAPLPSLAELRERAEAALSRLGTIAQDTRRGDPGDRAPARHRRAIRPARLAVSRPGRSPRQRAPCPHLPGPPPSRQFGVPSIVLDPLTLDPAIVAVISAEMARTHKILPLSRSGDSLTVAMADPTNRLALDDVRLTTGCRVEPVVTSDAALEDAIDLCYGPARPAGSRRGAALAEACAQSARTAWQYVTAMHAAALGGARRPIRGLVEDVEDMRVRLTRERDEARARVAELERRLAEATPAPPRPGRLPSGPPR